MTISDKPNVLLFREILLPASETFIVGQGEALSHFQPQYIGLRRVKGLPCPSDRTYTVSQWNNRYGKMSELAYKYLKLDLIGFHEQLQKLNPELIHAHFASGGMAALPIAEKLNIPLIVTFHGFDVTVRDDTYPVWKRKWIESRRKKLQQQGKLFIAVSQFIRKKMMEQGYPEQKIIQHYIGIDTERFTMDPAIEREPLVLFVGRLMEKKGASYLIEAMSLVQNRVPHAKLVIIGDGPLRKRLEQECQDVLNNYEFLGEQPPDQVKQYLNRAKVFSVPSIVADDGDAEGFGMVFAEANAMGVPVASFASGGITEAVTHEETGLLAPEKDAIQLARNIELLLTDEAIWRQYSEQGRKRVRRLFDVNKQNERLEQIYMQFIRKQEKLS